MNPISTFLFKEHTLDGYKVIGAGICPFIYKDSIVNSIKEKFRLFKFDIINDPFYIDYILASYVRSIACPSIYGLGISIYIPGITYSSGGIIGNPLNNIVSAEGIGQDIGNGLSVAAYPGGPGLIVNRPGEEAQRILNSINPGESSLDKLVFAVNKCIHHNIDIAIMVTDGSGKKGPGYVLSLENGIINYLTTDSI